MRMSRSTADSDRYAAALSPSVGDGGGDVCFLPLDHTRLEIEHFPVVALDTERACGFRVVARHHLEQDLRVTIALFDPARLRRECGRRSERDDQYSSSKHVLLPLWWNTANRKMVRC